MEFFFDLPVLFVLGLATVAFLGLLMSSFSGIELCLEGWKDLMDDCNAVSSYLRAGHLALICYRLA